MKIEEERLEEMRKGDKHMSGSAFVTFQAGCILFMSRQACQDKESKNILLEDVPSCWKSLDIRRGWHFRLSLAEFWLQSCVRTQKIQ